MNNTIKRQRSRAMEMRYFWLLDQKNNRYFKIWYKPGAENMGDYPSKAHTGAIHQHVRPYYLHMPNSPRTLLRADKPSSRRGCVELLGSPYYKGVPLPRIPSVHKLGTKSRIAQRSEHATVDPQGTYSHAGQSTFESRRQYSRSCGTAQHASTTKIPRNRAVLDAARCTNGILRAMHGELH